jgi:hypothetical protein
VVRRVHLGGKSALERQGSLALPFPGSRASGSVVAIAEDSPVNCPPTALLACGAGREWLRVQFHTEISGLRVGTGPRRGLPAVVCYDRQKELRCGELKR